MIKNMIKNKKLLIGLVCLAFCVCCAVFGIGFKSKNIIVAKADTISEATVKTASATAAKSISLVSDEISEVSVADKPEENHDIVDSEYIETEETEEEFSEEYDSESSARVDITVKVEWVDGNGNAHPLRGIKIQVKGISLITGYTNDFGEMYFSQLPGHVSIVAYAGDDNIEVRKDGGECYSYELEKDFEITEQITLEYKIRMNTVEGQAFQISQAIITARDFAYEMMGRKIPSPVSVLYPKGDHAYYYADRTIHLAARDGEHKDCPPIYASWDLIMHEYGHHIQNELNLTEFVEKPNEHWAEPSLNYHYGKNKGIRLAWVESWPTVFGLIAQKYYFEQGLLSNIQTVGDSCYTAYNILETDVNMREITQGEACEGSIEGLLWDLFDDDVEENDTIALGYHDFWDITTKTHCKTFSDFIKVFYDTYPNLIDNIGANLAYYDIAANNLNVTNVSLDNLPEFTWNRGGGPLSSYQNNLFLLKLYDSNNNLLVTDEISHNSSYTVPKYILDENQWKQVLNTAGNYFYWTVEAKNDLGNNVTGPYIAPKHQVSKPVSVQTITLNRPLRIDLNGSTADRWYKFTAPAAGSYTFYTEGYVDTYGDLYGQLYQYSNNHLASDDASGTNKNFKITYRLKSNETVYLKVKILIYFYTYNIFVQKG